ncbi:MAG: pyruvate dehydrogenase (acetyl-transferring) E1 component subunit alpha, partial [Actinobacteria bacterium]|nr:pyruvate dehydrogenase (acetyl-transferring) E1 component subunit alpha [Actinomycetota bacterium]
HPEYDPLIEDITDEDVRGFYRDLVLSRRVDTEAVALQRHGELGLWASMLGQEAAQVGSAR